MPYSYSSTEVTCESSKGRQLSMCDIILSQDNGGIRVVHHNIPRYNDKIEKRYIRFMEEAGSASNDGDQYYVIE